jgi:hypothetical protein
VKAGWNVSWMCVGGSHNEASGSTVARMACGRGGMGRDSGMVRLETVSKMFIWRLPGVWDMFIPR